MEIHHIPFPTWFSPSRTLLLVRRAAQLCVSCSLQIVLSCSLYPCGLLPFIHKDLRPLPKRLNASPMNTPTCLLSHPTFPLPCPLLTAWILNRRPRPRRSLLGVPSPACSVCSRLFFPVAPLAPALFLISHLTPVPFLLAPDPPVSFLNLPGQCRPWVSF